MYAQMLGNLALCHTDADQAVNVRYLVVVGGAGFGWWFWVVGHNTLLPPIVIAPVVRGARSTIARPCWSIALVPRLWRSRRSSGVSKLIAACCTLVSFGPVFLGPE